MIHTWIQQRQFLYVCKNDITTFPTPPPTNRTPQTYTRLQT
ncbi:hypothetical protein ACWATR_34575 [Nostoc sp. UIC 10890]